MKYILALAFVLAATAYAGPHYLSGELDHPSTSGGASSDLTMENHETGFVVGWPLSCAPDALPAAGTSWEYYQGDDGVVTVRFVNRGGSPVNPGATTHHCALNNYDE